MMVDSSTDEDVRTIVTPPKDWVPNPDGSLTRPLIGAEAFMAWMHDHREGGVSGHRDV